MALTKALQRRIDLANKYIKFAQKHDIWGRGYFGSTMESVFTYPHLITVSPTGRSVRVRYHDAYGGGKHSESFNTNDEYQVSDLRYEISNYIIKAIKTGAKDEGISIPKTLSNPRRR